MSMNLPVAPKLMREIIRSGAFLPTAWICIGVLVPPQSVIEWMRRGVGSEGWCEDSWGMACLVLGSLAMDCGVNISFMDLTVLVSNIENLLVKWGVGVTIDWPKNSLQPFPTPWPVWPFWPFWLCLLHPLQLQPLWPQGF